MKRASKTPRRRSEAEWFRVTLLRLRRDHKWTQPQLAGMLGVSKRTLSHWECGHWLPPFKQRLHVVLSLRNVPPEYVLEIADGLGVSVDPAVAPFLQPYKDALDPPVVEPAPVPPPPPAPRPPVDPEALRNAMDAVMRDTADGLNVLANDLRAAVGRALATCGAMGGTLEEMQEAVTVKAKPKQA
jgi:transcriptional regulator with XRE-family HTH domain